MFLNAHADLQSACYDCLFGSDESKAKGKDQLSDKVTPILQVLEGQLPASGFLHGGESPSLGDLCVFNVVTSKFPGLQALGVDMGPYPKIQGCPLRSSGGDSKPQDVP